MAHVASLGTSIDFDDPEKKEVPSFDLFLRLMDEKKYEGLLFGEISGTTQVNRLSIPLTTLLERQDLHSRLVNGSDYPLPAINIVIWTSTLVSEGFITTEERLLLNEIYDINPLLFDFVLKRTLRHPKIGNQFPPSIFLKHPEL
jgi:mannonate dehydratase